MKKLLATVPIVALLAAGCGGYGSKSKSHYKKPPASKSQTSTGGGSGY
jgi:hypothetical protein